MKVLHVIHDFLPRYVAGSELFAYGLCRSLRSMGVESEVLCGDDLPSAAAAVTRDNLDGIPVTRLQRHLLAGCAVGRQWDAVDGVFSQELAGIRPDVVHFHHFAGLSNGMVAVARRADIRSVFTLHDYWLTCPRFHLMNSKSGICDGIPGRPCVDCLWPGEGSRLLHPAYGLAVRAAKRLLPYLPESAPVLGQAKRALRTARAWVEDSQTLVDDIDVLVTPTEFVAHKLRERGITHADVRVIRNGIDSSRFAGIHRQPSARTRFGFIGSHTYKGLGVLIDALESLPADAAELHVYGRVPESLVGRVKRLAQRHDVLLHGPFEPSEVARAYESFDVLVAPSLVYETSSLVVMEAFASGAAVVASNLGAMAEAVTDGVNGLLFAQGDSRDLAAKLRMLIEDPGLAARMASAARARTIEDTAREYLELYEELARSQPARKVRAAK